MDSTSTIDELPAAGTNQEVRVNDVLRGMSPALPFAQRASTFANLTWGYYGVPRYYINATATTKANATIALTASSTRFVQVDRALAVTQVASAFDPDKLGLYSVVTGSATVTSWQDHRDPHHLVRFLYGRLVKAMGDANQTLNYAEAMCESIECTGNNTALRNLVVPLVPRCWTVFANTTTNGVQVIGASGTGTTIAVGKTAIVECDGTNVRRVTADNP